MKTLGPEEAAKCRPSDLSIEVWKLMEKTKKNDGDKDRSDENGRRSPENLTSLQAILNKLTATTPEMTTVNEIKVDADSDEYNTEEDSSQSEVLKEKPGVSQKKRLRISEEEPIDLPEQGFNSMDTMICDGIYNFSNIYMYIIEHLITGSDSICKYKSKKKRIKFFSFEVSEKFEFKNSIFN